MMDTAGPIVRGAKRGLGATALVLGAMTLAGCTALGAQRVSIDRGDYTQRLRETEKEQLLSNIVALRHGDAPLFLGVTSVISQYTRETSGRLDMTLSPPTGDDRGNAGGSVLLRETPTVTYTPMTGERFSHSLLAPIPPPSLMAMIEAGWASDLLFGIAIRSINGVSNTSSAALFAQASDPRFAEALGAFRRLQQSGGVHMRIRDRDKAFTATAHVSPTLTAADREDIERLGRTLGLRFSGSDMRIVFATAAAGPDEIALTTRSMFEILSEMGEGVDLTGEGRFADGALVRIHSGTAAPVDAHAAVKYRGRWFWIDAADDRSKRVFLLAQVLISLSDDAGAARSPLVTIPAG